MIGYVKHFLLLRMYFQSFLPLFHHPLKNIANVVFLSLKSEYIFHFCQETRLSLHSWPIMLYSLSAILIFPFKISCSIIFLTMPDSSNIGLWAEFPKV